MSSTSIQKGTEDMSIQSEIDQKNEVKQESKTFDARPKPPRHDLRPVAPKVRPDLDRAKDLFSYEDDVDDERYPLEYFSTCFPP